MKAALNKSEALDSVKPSEILARRRLSALSKPARMNFSTENYYFRECKEKQHILIKIWKKKKFWRDQGRRRLKIYHQL